MDARYVRVCSRRFRRVAARFGLSPPDADDAVQVTLLQIWLGGARLDPTTRAAWEDQVAANRARNLLRREHRRREELMPLDQEENGILDDSADPEACAISRRRIKVLGDLIAQIDPGRRDLFIKHELQGVPLHDLALEEGISLDAAKKRLARAWEDLERARDRWQAEQRRKRHDTTPAILPFGLLEARSRFTDAWRALPPRLRFLPIVGGLAVLAACLVPMQSPTRAVAAAAPVVATPSPPSSPPPSPPPSPEPNPGPSPPLRFSRAEGATGMTALQTALPKASAPPKPSPPPASATADVPLPYTATEESMITQAQVLIDACLLAEALAKLADHERAFPDGYFANRREALRKKAKTTRDCDRKARRRL